MTKNDVLRYLNKHTYVVLSTCGSAHQSESALIGFGETEKLEIIFGTNRASRKYKNILENARVSLVIGFGENATSLQYEGTATLIEDAEVDLYLPKYHQKVPSAAKFRSVPGQVYFKVTPTWIRYVDMASKDEQNVEFSFS